MLEPSLAGKVGARSMRVMRVELYVGRCARDNAVDTVHLLLDVVEKGRGGVLTAEDAAADYKD